jgi:dCTP deaminase
MLLSDKDIVKLIDNSEIILEPYNKELLQPASIDVRLDKFFRIFDNHKYEVIDPAVEQSELTRLVEVEDAFILHPGEMVLGSTYELVTLGNAVSARFEGKSSLGRLGILTHITAGFIDPGFSGHITLELANVSNLPIKLYPGMKIGQLCFFEMSSEVEKPYGSTGFGSHYQGQRGPTASKSFDNFYRDTI